MSTAILEKGFLWRRLHSLTGLWLTLFLFEHLLLNSQAGLWLGDNGHVFVQMVEGIHNLPYLHAIEIFLLGFPILIHGVWGVKYLWTAKFNSSGSSGKNPVLKLGRNRAYTWQRITAWIILFFLIIHIVKFRFLEYPHKIEINDKVNYFVVVNKDTGLNTVAERLKVKLHDRGDGSTIPGLETKKLNETEVIASSESFGTATLLTIRDTFKHPGWIVFYTIFVLATCFHAFNGFWTFLITWGVVLSIVAQRRMTKVAWGIMALVAFWGLVSIYGTYWFNLSH